MKRFVQFIAGAICPECKSQDTIALNPTDDEIYCVNCDFVEKRPKEKSNSYRRTSRRQKAKQALMSEEAI